MKLDKNRTKTRVAVYLIVTKEQNQILLGKRQNTGHMDGYWSLLAGHVYEGEACLAAAIREAAEECDLKFNPEDLVLIGAMHHKSGEFDYANYIFKADLGAQIISNLEPGKCERWDFFAYDDLPQPMADYVRFIIEKSMPNNGKWICEYGW